MMENMSVQEALEQFEVFWSNVECGITVIDAETREILDINPIAARMFGAGKSEIVGHRCHKFLCPNDVGSCPIMDKNQVVDRSERRFMRADGSIIPIIKSVAKVMLGGRLTLLESFTDISNLKEAEEKLRLLEVTERANSAKSDFLSRMSHEMRTPMNAIIGMTAIGKAADDCERKNYALGKIESASTHLLGIINDILDMSKIEAGKFELSLEDFHFEKMLQALAGVMSFRVNEKKQDFTLYIDEHIPPVLTGDDQRLTQIISNLLGNAIKFTPIGGSVRLAACLIKEEGGVCTIQFEVSDSGIGISPEQQLRIFDSYQQGDSATARKYGGTGLGLSISKNLIEMMNGKIWIESAPEQGATFAFTVQMNRGDHEAFEQATREADWRNVRILVVDDDTGIGGYVKNFVEKYGSYCDTATCGKDALKLARQNDAYDIWFVDWKLPDISATYLAKALRELRPGHNTAVIAMISSLEWGDIEESAKAAGINSFLPKPLFPSVIVDTVNDFLGVVGRQISETIEKTQIVFQGNHILLAEDIEMNQEILLALLEPTLLEIDCAPNGAEAVRMFREAPDLYDMIFMDVQMPEMDGLEATKQIRALGGPAADIPIVAMTASVFREDVERCLDAGMDDHLGKPLDLDEVMTKLRHYLHGLRA